MGQSTNEWILGRLSGLPADFAEADDIITNLENERDPGIQIIKHIPLSLIVTSPVLNGTLLLLGNAIKTML